MENEKPKMNQWKTVLRALSVVCAAIALVFLAVLFAKKNEYALYIFWISMTLAQCLDAIVTFDKKSKFSIYKLVMWTLLFAVWVVLLARLLL